MARPTPRPVELGGRGRSARLPITDNPSKTFPVNRHAIEQLRQCVLGDEDLQGRLRVIGDHGDFVAAVLEVAREHGLELTADELEEEMNIAQRAWALRWL